MCTNIFRNVNLLMRKVWWNILILKLFYSYCMIYKTFFFYSILRKSNVRNFIFFRYLVQLAAKLFKHLRKFVSVTSFLMQFHEIDICQVMIFKIYTVYKKHEMIRINNQTREKNHKHHRKCSNNFAANCRVNMCMSCLQKNINHPWN